MAYSSTVKLVVGDTLPELTFTLKDSNTAASGQTLDTEDSSTWAPIDFSSGVVKLRIRQVGTTTVSSTITLSLSSPTNGQCNCAFPTGTWTSAGTFEGEIEFKKADATRIQTVQDFVKFQVREDFD